MTMVNSMVIKISFIIKKQHKNNYKNSSTNYPKNVKASGFNNFEPRSYDYDSLEKKLLGWDVDD